MIILDNIFINRIAIVSVAFMLDLLLGDPHSLWHPVQGIGKVITLTEKFLRSRLRISDEREADKDKKRVAGFVICIVVIVVSVIVPLTILYIADCVNDWLRFFLECIMCYQLLAMKSLRDESMKVYKALSIGDVEQARTAVSMIVGRDTKSLDEAGITRAAVETVAENTVDGVIAPLMFMIIFGTAGVFFYKAVNTMDSMLGYKNDQYIYMGTVAAKLDDVLNYVPARLSAYLMVVAALLLGLDYKNAWRIYRRDRYNHASPNSAQTEACCAGALRLRLAGDAYYFGVLYKKPYIGDGLKPIEAADIQRANSLMYVTAFLTLSIGIAGLIVAIMLT